MIDGIRGALLAAPSQQNAYRMESVGIYIQIPFCASKCTFCNFSSQVAPAKVFDAYVDALEREIRGLNCRDLSRRLIDTVYAGGGTPSLLGAERLKRIFSALQDRFSIIVAAEFTLEITPGSADDKLLDKLVRLGVNRLSIGAQSFDDRELRCVGRLHTAADIDAQVSRARRAGFQNISLDLIAGLPHQSMASWQTSLQRVVRLHPEHVSVYLFEADEKSRLGSETLRHGSLYSADSVPDEDFQAEAYECAREFLAAEGYRQYEISNFALPAFESRHNQRYWQRRPYLGFGAGAHSFDGTRRWMNVVDPDAYCQRLAQGELPIAESRELSPTEQVEEFFFLGLRQRRGVSLGQARGKWGNPPWDWWKARADTLKQEGWLEEEGGWLRLSQRALLVSNEIFQEFLE